MSAAVSTQEEGERRLYSVAIEVWQKGDFATALMQGRVRNEVVNTHATSAGLARINVLATIKPNEQCRVVAVGLAVGFFCDENGENLSAE